MAAERASRRASEESLREASGRAAQLEISGAGLLRERDTLQRGLDEVMSSRAVQAARALRELSPGLHRQTAWIAGLLAFLSRPKGR